MIKNGLFLCSIGLLVFLFSLDPSSMQFNFLNLFIGIILIASGGYIVYKGNKKQKEEQRKTKGGVK
ncbi:DUF3188 domain-containing protein [Candidatus Enterococcus ikei]|uniref:DUF3188 domain-containing protein n=1 Tax=Candidatus Enterococcus ikei TaxID=2815326 RepID=A0ABS3GV38_9ENTE|nr:DUF3188 domain-containing protein [Enterococcus sp. DIV0869a]MBO0439113.1 DUF3188 domain-containing protein [Enterococcus sp. DIV0869a]